MAAFRALNPGCGCGLASSELPNQWLFFLAFQWTGGKENVREFSKKFREVDMMFAIAFYVENLLMTSLPRAENTKYATRR
jgi:hypothetical protein